MTEDKEAQRIEKLDKPRVRRLATSPAVLRSAAGKPRLRMLPAPLHWMIVHTA